MKNRLGRMTNETNCIAVGLTPDQPAWVRAAPGRQIGCSDIQTEAVSLYTEGYTGWPLGDRTRSTVITNQSRPEAQVPEEGRPPPRECPDLAQQQPMLRGALTRNHYSGYK